MCMFACAHTSACVLLHTFFMHAYGLQTKMHPVKLNENIVVNAYMYCFLAVDAGLACFMLHVVCNPGVVAARYNMKD